MSIAENLAAVQEQIDRFAERAGRESDSVNLIAVAKTKPQEAVIEALQAGQMIFGENRVQESQGKYPDLRADWPDLELHLIGPLQSNKTKDAMALFDVIHTVDRPKLVRSIAREAQTLGRCPKLLIQVNTGEEAQKAGVLPNEFEALVQLIRDENLPLAGLMCIPPVEDAPAGHFAFLKRLADGLELPLVSMGMSGDYQTAVELGATHIRVGSAIFGARPPLNP
ncbi:MAG: YggS family pyridoxal phosphate-dependent enzyme [Alphaproteobacteria bacterium TMED89]|nr:YggS family pyridoxal phosphate-dependent enzyme [Rhodospirillaceae bacterium]RPH16345.1 MAG: YggS family pyridoxal phosphate-dependent enzyme [Alphaproteobacteria bacterium TMED89]